MARTSTFPSTLPLFLFHFHYLSSSFSIHVWGGVLVLCRCYTAREKLAILLQICQVKWETNVSYCWAAAPVGVSHMLVFCCHTLRKPFNNIDIKKLPCYSAHIGPCGQFEGKKEAWCAVFLRNTRLYTTWGQKCPSVPPAMCAKRRWNSRSLSVRYSQRGIGVRSSVHQNHQYGPDASIFFDASPKTFEILGTKTILICTIISNTKHTTVVLAITAAGDQLVPMVVYKGAENGMIKRCELPMHKPTCIYKT